jgi:hypothetical protein
MEDIIEIPTESQAVILPTEKGGAADILSTEHRISDNTRRVFKEKMAERRAKEAELARTAVSLYPEDAPAAAAAPTAAIPAATPGASPAAAAEAPAQVEPEQPIAAPSGPNIADIVAQQHAAALELREQALIQREQEIDARAAAIAAKEHGRSSYAQKPADTIRALVKEWTGADGDELRDEIADLITDLSATMLNVPVPEAFKARAEGRKALRSVNAWKAEAAEQEAKATAAREAADQQAREQNAVRVIGGFIGTAKDKYPHLAAEDNAAAIVFDLIKREAAASPNPATFRPDWESAAKRANEYFKKRNDEWFAARQPLLVPPATKPAPAAAPAVQQGERQGVRSSTLTHQDASVTVAPSEPAAAVVDEDANAPYDRDAATKRLFARWREKIKVARQ